MFVEKGAQKYVLALYLTDWRTEISEIFLAESRFDINITQETLRTLYFKYMKFRKRKIGIFRIIFIFFT